jgi:hypothetical protein
VRRTLILLGVLLAAIGAGAFGAYGALQAHASAKSLALSRPSHVIGKVGNARSTSDSALAPGVQELARNEGLSLAALKQVSVANGAHPARVFAATKGTATCAYLTGGTGAVGGCMKLAADLLAPRIAVVDGGTYVWGLSAPSVSSVQARTGGQTFTGSTSNGIFTVEILDGSHGTGPITLVATANGSTSTIILPGIPTPLP